MIIPDKTKDTNQIDNANGRWTILCTFCKEEKTFASLLSPGCIMVGGLALFATNIAAQSLQAGWSVVKPKEMFNKSKFSDRVSDRLPERSDFQ